MQQDVLWARDANKHCECIEQCNHYQRSVSVIIYDVLGYECTATVNIS